MTYVIALPCVDVLDKACVEECPVDCIYEGERMLYIHPDECVDCGACEPVCPVEAIFYEDDLPEQWKDFYKANVEFFDDLGSPGGAAKLGKIEKDHPVVVRAPAAGRRALTQPVSARLPDFPWDSLAAAAERARAHPDGIVDLSVGTPVDPTPETVQAALRAAADAPGYPTTQGTPQLRAAAVRWLARRLGVREIGPGGGAADHRLQGAGGLAAHPARPRAGRASWWCPQLAYPTYAVGAQLAGAEVVVADSLVALGPRRVDLVWVNSPANPTGRVLPAEHLRKVVAWARERGALVVSDECYIELGWDAEPVSVLHPDVTGGSLRRAARRPLAVEAVEPGRLPRRVRRR